MIEDKKQVETTINSEILFYEIEYICLSFAKTNSIDKYKVLKAGLEFLKETQGINAIDLLPNKDLLSKLKVAEIKELLKIRDLKRSGNKKELINRLIDYYEILKSDI